MRFPRKNPVNGASFIPVTHPAKQRRCSLEGDWRASRPAVGSQERADFSLVDTKLVPLGGSSVSGEQSTQWKEKAANSILPASQFCFQPSKVAPHLHSLGRGKPAPCLTSLVLLRSLNREPSDHSRLTHPIRSHTSNFPQAAPWHRLLYRIKV